MTIIVMINDHDDDVQVYSGSKSKRTCRLCSWSTLTDPSLGYIDHTGHVTLGLSLDMDTHARVHILTENSIRENFAGELFTEKTSLTTMSVAKNIRFSSILSSLIKFTIVESLRQFFCDLEEECETITAQPLETSHIAPTSIWSLGQEADWRPRRMTNDAYRTLFQLKEYHLLQDLYVFVETELLQQVQDQPEPGKEIRKRKSDILCFALLSMPSNGEDVIRFLGPIALSANTKLKVLVEKCKILLDRKISTEAKLCFQMDEFEFNEENVPEDKIVESGSVIKVIVAKVDRKGINIYLLNPLNVRALIYLMLSIDGKKDLNVSKKRLKLQRQKEKQTDKKSSGKSKPFTLGFVRISRI